jgi:hypothetical protein
MFSCSFLKQYFVFYQVVGAATLLVEKKFIHECGQVGRVEDVVVSVRITLVPTGTRVAKTGFRICPKCHLSKRFGFESNLDPITQTKFSRIKLEIFKTNAEG